MPGQSAGVVRMMVAVYDGPLDRRELLASVGLSPDGSGEDPPTVLAEDNWRLVERMAAHGSPDLPVRFASAVSLDRYGALGLAVKTAPTLREALERLARYFLVVTDTATYTLRDSPGGAALVMRRDGDRLGIRISNEAGLAAVVAVLRQIAGTPLRPAAVWFRHPTPACPADLRGFFGCSVSFGAPENAIHLDSDMLEAPTRLGDDGLSRFVLAHLDEEWRETRAAASLEAQVQDAVADALSGGIPRMSRTAARLGMSERTLQRRLAERGQAYSGLVDAARRRLAETLLVGSDHPLAEVAYLTGFSEQSAFHRAFKRWTGMTPAAYRDGATEEAGGAGQ